MLKSALMSSVALAAAITFAPTASAFDCAKASKDTEKLICADPAAKAADDAMAAAYEALLPTLKDDQPAMLKASQVAWIKLREQNCGWQETAAEKTACLVDITTKRTAYLTGTPASGPGYGESPKLTPVLFSRPFGKGKCSADVSLYRFAGAAADPGEKALDSWVSQLTSAIEKDFGSYTEGDLPEGMSCEYSATASITYASPDVIAMNVGVYMFGGGAHGNYYTTAVTLDRKNGKTLAFADIFDAAAAKSLTAACTDGIKAEKIKRFAESGIDQAETDAMIANDMTAYAEAIGQGVGDFANWIVYDDRAEVYFAPYALGSYAEGDYTCPLSKDMLAKAAGSKGWIIP